MEETVLGIVTVEPEVVGKAEEGCPQNTRNKERSEKHPKRAVALLKKPTAEPRSYRVAHKKAGKGPRRLIQLHTQIRNNGPCKSNVQKEATPRVGHFSEASGKAIANFRETRQMSVPQYSRFFLYLRKFRLGKCIRHIEFHLRTP